MLFRSNVVLFILLVWAWLENWSLAVDIANVETRECKITKMQTEYLLKKIHEINLENERLRKRKTMIRSLSFNSCMF